MDQADQIAQLVGRAVKQAGTQQRFADRLKKLDPDIKSLTRETVSHWTRGICIPREDHAQAIAMAIDTEGEDFAHLCEMARRSKRPLAVGRSGKAQAFATSVMQWVEELARGNADGAVVVMRANQSRFLHLVGARAERQAIGRLALDSAAALKDRLTQASVLIDDLGWTTFEDGKRDEAFEHIGEGIGILSDEIHNGVIMEQIFELRAKGKRHLAAIAALDGDFDGALAHIEDARQDSGQLQGHARQETEAQLIFAEAWIVNVEAEHVCPGKQPLSPNHRLMKKLAEALIRCDEAARIFQEVEDSERVAKSLRLKVDLLKRYGSPAALREVEARLERAQESVQRDLAILKL